MASSQQDPPTHQPHGNPHNRLIQGSENPITFAAMASRPRIAPRFPPLAITSRNIGMKDGKPSVSFSTVEYNAGAKRFSFSLIAKFTVGRPHIKDIQASFQHNWRIEGRATISEIWDSRHILIILDSERDVTAALSCPLRRIGNSMFRLFRWHQEYNPRNESPTTTAWVRLPDLPLPLYDAAFIEVIVSSFGTYLDVDDRTKACLSVKFARVCMEIDVSKPVPDSVWVNLPNGQGYWQKIEMESNLRYCQKCKIHGHDFLQCRKVTKKSEEFISKRTGGNDRQGNTSNTKQQMKDKADRNQTAITKAAEPMAMTNNDTQIAKTQNNDVRGASHSGTKDVDEGWTKVEKRKAIRVVNAIVEKRNQNTEQQQKTHTTKNNETPYYLPYRPKQLPVSIPLAPDDIEEGEVGNDQIDETSVTNAVAKDQLTENIKDGDNRLQVVLYEAHNGVPLNA